MLNETSNSIKLQKAESIAAITKTYGTTVETLTAAGYSLTISGEEIRNGVLLLGALIVAKKDGTVAYFEGNGEMSMYSGGQRVTGTLTSAGDLSAFINALIN